MSLIKSLYYYPLSGTGFTNVWMYKTILGLQNSWLIRYAKRKLIAKYILESQKIPAYITLYQNTIDIPITNKEIFHNSFDVKGRIPIGTSVNDFHILKTSGSSSGVPAKIPVSDVDITRFEKLLY